MKLGKVTVLAAVSFFLMMVPVLYAGPGGSGCWGGGPCCMGNGAALWGNLSKEQKDQINAL